MNAFLTRSRIRLLLGGVSFLALVCRAGAEESAERRKLLFFDLWKLDEWANLELVQGEPEYLPDAAFVDPSDPPRGVYFPTVWRERETGTWRAVYSNRWSPLTLMAAESGNGRDWRPSPMPEITPEGGKEAPHHLFSLPGGQASSIYLDPKATDGYRFRIFTRQHGEPVIERALADPDHPWHEVVAKKGDRRYVSEGVTVVSKDGIHWETRTGGHWNWLMEDWYPEPPVFAFFNHRAGLHTKLVRPGWGDRRQCIRTSEDLVTWSEPELLFQPDSLDTSGPIGFYGLPVHPVGNGAGFVGLLWVFRNANSEPVGSFNQFFGTMDNELVWSYDGIRFRRTARKPFVERTPMPEFGCTQMRTGSIVETDDEVLIFSEGHRGEHGRERSEQRINDHPLTAMVVHRLRKDGWMYLRSGGDWARFKTKPLTLFKPGIHLNVSVPYGEVRFQVCDEKSVPIEGFTFDDCVPIRGMDSLSLPLEWKGDPDESTLTGRLVRLEIQFRNAHLYSIDMAHHFLDAQDKWLLEDGMPVPAKRFDF